jgi:CRP/FNR family transcriptional regulator, cyclic AMP receptor protein
MPPSPARRAISVLDLDPELGAQLSPAELRVARAAAMAPIARLQPGRCDPWEWVGDATGHLGLLVIDGLLSREVTLLGRTTMQLLGSEDLLRPWDDASAEPSVPHGVRWTVQRPTRVAVLDRHFAQRMAPWPALTDALVSRSLGRELRLAVHLAILDHPRVDVRLLLLFWYLADRWGRVEPGGVTLPLTLTHSMLGRLVRAHRPTVTARLHELDQRGLVSRRPDGVWVLHGDPAGQLQLLAAA